MAVRQKRGVHRGFLCERFQEIDATVEHCRRLAARIIVSFISQCSLGGLLHTSFSVANFAASGIDSLVRLRWLLDDLKASAVTSFAFDFDFVRQGHGAFPNSF